MLVEISFPNIFGLNKNKIGIVQIFFKISVIIQRLPITGPGGRSTAIDSIMPPLVNARPVADDFIINWNNNKIKISSYKFELL